MMVKVDQPDHGMHLSGVKTKYGYKRQAVLRHGNKDGFSFAAGLFQCYLHIFEMAVTIAVAIYSRYDKHKFIV